MRPLQSRSRLRVPGRDPAGRLDHQDRRPDGARFVARFRAAIGERPDPLSVYAAQATEVMLDAIGRSDGTRRSIAHELFATRVHDGLVGSFAITPQGDTTARKVTICRVTHGALEPWRVIEPSTQLTSIH